MSRDCVPEKVQEAIFNELLGQPENQECADCENKSPTWVSLDFGVFLCIRCSGVHRQLGPHITRVRSTKLDGWKKENIEIMAHTGNKVSNDYYEFKMPSGYRKPTTNYTMEQCRKFVDEKYIKKLFAPPEFPTPVQEFLANREKGVIKQPTLHKEHSQPSESHEKKMILRKRSVSLEPHNSNEKQHHKTESKTETKNNHLVDLLSADDDFFGKKNTTDSLGDFGDFNKAEVVEPKKINFDSFKKANNTQQQQQQTQDLFGFSTQTKQTENNNNTNNTQNWWSSNTNQNQQLNQNTQLVNNNDQQKQQTTSNNNQPDFKSLYGQSSNTSTVKTSNSAWDSLDFHHTTQNQNQHYGNQMNSFNNNYHGGFQNNFQNVGFNQNQMNYGSGYGNNNFGNMAGNNSYNQNNLGNNGFNNNNNMGYGYQNQFSGPNNNNTFMPNNYLSAPNKFF